MTKTFTVSQIKKNQPIVNIGTIGHVSHGKSTLVKAFTGKHTPRRSDEIERNITIQLGFANLRIYYNDQNQEFKYSDKILDETGYKLINHISFVDCPGHNAYIATMISGSKVFDAALLVIASNSEIPSPQTLKHTQMLPFTSIQDILIVLNKIDLLKDQIETEQKIKELQLFIDSNPSLINKPVIPICASKKQNIDSILEFLCNIQNNSIIEKVNEQFQMDILRSFHINSVGTKLENLNGGIVGGSIVSGYIEIGDKIGIFPGHCIQCKETKEWVIRPIFSTVESLKSEKDSLDIAFSGGLIGIGLDCDPGICKQDDLLGNNLFKLCKKNINLFIDPTNYSYYLDINIEFLIPTFKLEIKKKIVIVANSKPIVANVKAQNESGTFSIKLERPIYCVNLSKIPLIALVDSSITVFGIGSIVNASSNKNKVSIKFPSDYGQFIESLPDDFEKIEIINDSESIDFDTSNLKLENLIQNIVLEENSKIKFPDLQIHYDPGKIFWVNFLQYQEMVNQIIINKDLSFLRVYSLEKVIVPYIAYVYGLTSNLVNCLNNVIEVHIKTKRLKQKLDRVVKIFFKHYYYCEESSCKQLSAILAKVNSKPQKVCLLCGSRTPLMDQWLKEN